MAKGEAPASIPAPAEAEAAAPSSSSAPAAASGAPPPPRRSLFARLFRRRKSASPDWNPKKIAAANPPERDIVLSVPSSGSEGGGAKAEAAAKAKEGEGGGGSTIEHGGETVVRICRVGAAVRSLILPDGTDIVLGSDETLPYLVREKRGGGE